MCVDNCCFHFVFLSFESLDLSFDGSGPNGTAPRSQGIQAKILHSSRSFTAFQRYFRPPLTSTAVSFTLHRGQRLICSFGWPHYITNMSTIQGHDPLQYLSKTDLLTLRYHAFTVYKQDITLDLGSQLTRLASFDYLLDKSHSETDGYDARTYDLTRRLFDKR